MKSFPALFRERCWLKGGWGLALLLGAAELQAQPFGLTERVANTTLTLPLLPPQPPSFTYDTTNAFGNLPVTDPVAIVTPPGETNRLFVVQQAGQIMVLTNLAQPNLTLFMDIDPRVAGGGEQGLLGLAFHPGYASNGWFYVYYSRVDASQLYQRLSRFSVLSGNPDRGDTASEAPLLTLLDNASNHNGGDLHFGPDGYLYLALGDEGGGNDNWNNSQIIDKDFWSGILRLDVDGRPENLAPNPHSAIHAGTYRVPADNPLVGVTTWYGSNLVATAVRTEFYAIGLRNPWRMSFDRESGRLYCGDVGQTAREEINVIVKGGNYGWAFREGFIGATKPTPPGAMPIDPILDYPRTAGTQGGTSVTGGVVYRGSRYPQLYGHYIFADYLSGNLWSTYYDGVSATPKEHLVTDTSITGFGVDPRNGDVLLADQGQDRIKRLVVIASSEQFFPETLDATGAFSDLASLTPATGVVPYDVNLESWTDHATARRWFSVPQLTAQITYRATTPWSTPSGSVFLQHFDLEITNGVPESRRRLETRFLVREASGSSLYGVTYRWDAAQTNAALVAEDGEEETIAVYDASGALLREQTWRYPSRNDCLRCHTLSGGLLLGFNTPQLNRDFDYDGVTDNQLRSLEHVGYFRSNTPVVNRHLLPAMARLTDTAVSAEYRVRSYLALHCAPCHTLGGGGLGNFDLRLVRTLTQTGLLGGLLLDDQGDPDNRAVAPGSEEHSMVLTRLAAEGALRMPPVGSTLLDTNAIELLREWISDDLADYRTFAQWQLDNFGSTNAPEAQAEFDADEDGETNYGEYLLGHDPMAPGDRWAPVAMARDGDGVAIEFDRVAGRGYEVEFRESLSGPGGWQPLNVPDNAPFFSATNGVSRVLDEEPGVPLRIYRVEAFER